MLRRGEISVGPTLHAPMYDEYNLLWKLKYMLLRFFKTRQEQLCIRLTLILYMDLFYWEYIKKKVVLDPSMGIISPSNFDSCYKQPLVLIIIVKT